jgi:hypothetical protein
MIVEFDKSFEKSLEKIKNKSLYEKIEQSIIDAMVVFFTLIPYIYPVE